MKLILSSTMKKNRAKVEDHRSLERDLTNKAIVNTDTSAYERYMNDKEVRQKYKNEIDTLKMELEELKKMIMNK
tara:strand:+ start:1234 stop:1455 length:222 start_codon:yes stop_codon:yes gene_type:complete